jgi:superfamily II DNA or RNA helicase
MKQREYQIDGINSLADKFGKGFKRLICQLATGGGKTVMFAGLVRRWMQARETNILIVVHREELLRQARKTIYNWYGVIAEPVTAKTKHAPHARIWVTMVETANNRLKKNPNFFPNVGLVIIDEAHIGNFLKILPYYPEQLTIGFTATPIGASKKKPLKDYFEDIVTCIDIKGLIEIWQDDYTQGLVPNMTFAVKEVKREELTISGNDFDNKQMSEVYSGGKHVENTVRAYEKFGVGKKTIIFNVSKEHSIKVNQAFQDAGYNSRHLDDESKDRVAILEWFARTEDAVLNNIGVLTAGFDEPSIRTVIVNKDTLSLALWLQMTGRGARPFREKDFFVIVDMGTNAKRHGDWCAQRDWADIFHNPEKSREGGVGGVKECDNCGCLIPVSSRLCKFCGEGIVITAKDKYDINAVEFELFTQDSPVNISVKDIVHENAGRRDYYSLHQIKYRIVNHYKGHVKEMTDDVAYKMLAIYQDKVQEWCAEKGRNYNQWHKENTAVWFFEAMKTMFQWEPTPLTLDL